MASDDYDLNEDQRSWSCKKRQGCCKTRQRELLVRQKGCCEFSGVKFVFGAQHGTPIAGGAGCHPLYPAVDHIVPGNRSGGYQLICYDLNDLKGTMGVVKFFAVRASVHWKRLMEEWRQQSAKDPFDRAAFQKLIRDARKWLREIFDVY